MARWSITTGIRTIKGMFERERVAGELVANREKALVELGWLAHRKIGSGQIADPELAALSSTVDGWDEMLRQLIAKRDSPNSGDSGLVDEMTAAQRAGALSGIANGAADSPRAPGAQWRTSLAPIAKHSVFGAMLSVVIMLLICLAISLIANGLLNGAATTAKQTAAGNLQTMAQEKADDLLPDALDGKLGARAADQVRELIQGKMSDLTRLQQEADFDMIDVPIAVLLVNNVQSNARIQAGDSLASGGIQLNLGVYAFLLVPLLAFFIGGYAAAWRIRLASARAAVLLALGIGILYALFLGLLTLAAGFSTTVALPGGAGSADAAYRFSMASALFNGLVLGTLFSLAGSLFRMGKFKFTAHLRSVSLYGEAFHQAVAAIVRGVGLSLVYVLVLLWSKGALSVVMILLLPQLAVYGWNMANGNLFHVTDFITGQHKPIQSSIFTGIRGSGLEAYASEWNLYIILSVLLPIILFVAAGMRARAAHDDRHKFLLAASAIYGGLMAILVLLTNIGVTVRGKVAFLNVKSMTIEAGFAPLAAFVACFIIAYACMFLGMKWKDRFILRRNRMAGQPQSLSK